MPVGREDFLRANYAYAQSQHSKLLDERCRLQSTSHYLLDYDRVAPVWTAIRDRVREIDGRMDIYEAAMRDTKAELDGLKAKQAFSGAIENLQKEDPVFVQRAIKDLQKDGHTFVHTS